MMENKFIISAFADEAATDLQRQIDALLRNGDAGCEVRGINGENINNMSVPRVREYAAAFASHGISVFSLGSPAGKTPLRGNIHKDEEDLKSLCEKAHIFGASRIRIFSFYPPAGVRHADTGAETVERLGRFLDIAKSEDIYLCHENERGIYGQGAADSIYLANRLPDLRLVFDPANFVLAGEDTLSAWHLLRGRVDYLHIKDAFPDGRVVPAGEGCGALKEILTDYAAAGGQHVTVEPHLHVFSGLDALEGEARANIGSYGYTSADRAFDAAHEYFKKLVEVI